MDPNSFESIKAAVGRQRFKSEKLDALQASLTSSYGFLSADQVAQLVEEFTEDDKLKAVKVCAPRMYSITCEQAASILHVFSNNLSKPKALEIMACHIVDDNWPAFDSVLCSSSDLKRQAKEILKNRPRSGPQTGPPPQPGVYPSGVGPPPVGFPGMAPQPGGYPSPAPYPGPSPYPGQSPYPGAGQYGGMCPPGHSPYAPPGPGAAPPQYPGAAPPQYPGATPPQYPTGTVPPAAGQPPYTPPFPGAVPPQYPTGTVPPGAGQPPYAPPGAGPSSFVKIKSAVEKQNNKSDKLDTLQSSLFSSCDYLSADQVAQLVQEFSLDLVRLQAVEICAPKMYNTTCDQAACILRVFDFDPAKLKALEVIACHITDNNFAVLDSVMKFERGRAREILMNRYHPGQQPGPPPKPGDYPGVGSPAGSFPGMAPQTGSYSASGMYPGPLPYPGQSPYPGAGGMRLPGRSTQDPFGTAPFPFGNTRPFAAMEEMMKAHSAMMQDMTDMFNPTPRQGTWFPASKRHPKTGFRMFDED